MQSQGWWGHIGHVRTHCSTFGVSSVYQPQGHCSGHTPLHNMFGASTGHAVALQPTTSEEYGAFRQPLRFPWGAFAVFAMHPRSTVGHTLAIHWPYTYSWLFTSVMGAWASTWLVATKWQPGNPRLPTSIQVRRIHFGDMLTCCHSLGGYRENGSNMRSRQLAGSNLRGRKRGAMLLPMSILWCGCRPKCTQYGLLSN